jgi:hypothetical protein
MKVDFYGMRRNLAMAYHKAVGGFRTELIRSADRYLKLDPQLKQGLDELRSMIGALLSTSSDGEDKFGTMNIYLNTADPDDEDGDDE